MGRLIAIVSLLIAWLPAAIWADNSNAEWEEVRNKEGIRVFTRSVADSPILFSKAICTLEADTGALTAILDDNTNHTRWVPFLLESRRLEATSETERLEYHLFQAPWPISNRDFVYRAKATTDSESGAVFFTMRSEPNPLMPEQKGVVRGTLLEGTFVLTPLKNGHTEVEMLFHADPGGWVPVWIANIIQRAWPYFVLKGLRREVTTDQ